MSGLIIFFASVQISLALHNETLREAIRAHREFVRLSNKIALRKRQQRNRPEEIARLYQLEIIKLRMQVQEMTKIDRDARRIEGMRHEA